MRYRFVALLICIFLFVGIVSGCDRTENSDPVQEHPSQSETEYAYRAESVLIDKDLVPGHDLSQITSFCVSGNSAFFSAEFLAEEDESASYIDPVSQEQYGADSSIKSVLFAMDLSSHEITLLNYQQTELDKNQEGSFSLSEFSTGADGTAWIIEMAETYSFDLPENFDANTDNKWNYYNPSSPIITLMQYNERGEQVSSASITLTNDLGFYFNFMADRSGNVYCTDINNVYVFDATGAEKGAVSYEDGYLVQLGADGVGILSYGHSGDTTILPIDPVAMAYGDTIQIDRSSFLPAPGNQKYVYTYINNGMIFGADRSSLISVQVLDFLSCDINDSRVNDYAVLDDGRIVALEGELIDENGTETRYTVHVIEKKQLQKSENDNVLTLAASNLDNAMKDRIIAFNKKNFGVRIVVRNYSADDAVSLFEDISSENAPDMVLTAGLPVYQLAYDGKLLDLWPLIENDPEIGREGLMTHLLDTVSVDGKLHELASSFSIISAAAKQEYAGEKISWDFNDLETALKMLAEDATIFGNSKTVEGFLNQYFSITLDQYYDFKNGKYDFETDEFIDQLEFIARLSSETEENATATPLKGGEYSRLYNNTQLLTQNKIDSFDQIKYANAMHGGLCAFVGYPAENESGSLFILNNPIAITSNCKDSEAAWKFVRTFVSNDYSDINSGFPVNRNAFEAYAKIEMTPVYETNKEGEFVLNEAGEKIEISNGSIRLEDILKLDLYAVTQAEYNQFMDLYENCNAYGRENTELIDLVITEINGILVEGKSAADTASAIQSAASEYLKKYQ